MKKLLLVLGVALAAGTAAQAQGFSFGLRAGANYSTIGGSDKKLITDDQDPSYKFGFHGGLVTNFAFSDMVSLQPELLYSTKGYGYDFKEEFADGSKSDFETKLKTQYIDIPVLVKVNAEGLFFELGPQASFLLSAEESFKGSIKDVDGNEETIDETEDVKDGMKGFELSYVAGVGYQLPMGLGVGVRYVGGLTSIVDDVEGQEFKVKNQVFQLSLSYMFGAR